MIKSNDYFEKCKTDFIIDSKDEIEYAINRFKPRTKNNTDTDALFI